MLCGKTVMTTAGIDMDLQSIHAIHLFHAAKQYPSLRNDREERNRARGNARHRRNEKSHADFNHSSLGEQTI
jgi:hypothetical protein